MLGQSIGRYHIVEKLGEGGMATVYKAYDTRLEREVALKVLLQDRRHSEKFLKRFEREARALAQLSHPNIVKVLDYGEHEGMPYLVMEYIAGRTLKEKMGTPLPYREAANLLAPVARALEYVHQHKIVHRDVKPANILITESGQPMLSDFGIAKMLEAEETMDLTGTGVGVGTPEYMAPEQGLGKGVDHRADIYALGIVFYELITGRKPFRADTPMAVVIKQINEPLPRPKQFARDVPDSVERVLFKALAKNAVDRFEDMGAFAKVLEQLGQGNKVSVGNVRTASPRVSPLMVGAAALAIVMIISAFVVSGWIQQASPARVVEVSATSQIIQATATTQPTITLAVTYTPSPKPPISTPTVTPTLPPAPQLFNAFTKIIFHDDFDSGIDPIIWSQWPSSWRIVDDTRGNRVLSAERLADNTRTGSKIGNSSWQNYRVFLRVNFLEAGQIYIVVGDGPKGRYAIYFVDDGRLGINKRRPGTQNDLGLGSTSLNVQRALWYTFDLLVEPPQIIIAINGRSALEYKDDDTSPLIGKVELHTWSDGRDGIDWNTGLGGKTKILIDDVTVFSR